MSRALNEFLRLNLFQDVAGQFVPTQTKWQRLHNVRGGQLLSDLRFQSNELVDQFFPLQFWKLLRGFENIENCAHDINVSDSRKCVEEVRRIREDSPDNV